MIKFKDIVDSPCGIRYCFDSLELQSGYARKSLLESFMMTSVEAVESSYQALEKMYGIVISNRALVSNIQFKLQGLREIGGTLSSLAEGSLLDDIDFFEVKHLALLADEIRSMLSLFPQDWYSTDLDSVISILDPDGLRIGTFYIYDSYSEKLFRLRKALESNPEDESLISERDEEELSIRRGITSRLRPYASDMKCVMDALAHLDILIAKAVQKADWNLTIPQRGDKAYFEGLFNPQVKEALMQRGRDFQRIDFEYADGAPSIVIGANMGGKTVVLKTLCLCQYLMQFGFAVPAAKACMMMFDHISFIIGDEQDMQKGFSSFTSEMVRIDAMIKSVESGERVLALVDEPARTTNPVEGEALVSSLLNILSKKDNLSLLLTTHYKVSCSGTFWRVKGLVEGNRGMKMDYALIRTSTGDVPHEALNIAREMGIWPQWLEEASRILTGKSINNYTI